MNSIMRVSYNPVFKAKYTNPDGSIVNLNREGIRQAEEQARVRTIVEDAMAKCPNQIVDGSDLYFTINRSGKCIISNKEEIPVYGGRLHGFELGDCRSPREIETWKFRRDLALSDEGGNIRANGNGYKFATRFKDGSIRIWPVASEVFPEKSNI